MKYSVNVTWFSHSKRLVALEMQYSKRWHIVAKTLTSSWCGIKVLPLKCFDRFTPKVSIFLLFFIWYRAAFLLKNNNISTQYYFSKHKYLQNTQGYLLEKNSTMTMKNNFNWITITFCFFLWIWTRCSLIIIKIKWQKFLHSTESALDTKQQPCMLSLFRTNLNCKKPKKKKLTNEKFTCNDWFFKNTYLTSYIL